MAGKEPGLNAKVTVQQEYSAGRNGMVCASASCKDIYENIIPVKNGNDALFQTQKGKGI
jgi:hypothetical protein